MRSLLISLLAAGGCVADVPSVDHHDPRSFQGYRHMEEGCYEVLTDDGYSRYPSTCTADDGFRCVFAVVLSDGSVGCCAEDEGSAQVSGDSEALWHSCEGL